MGVVHISQTLYEHFDWFCFDNFWKLAQSGSQSCVIERLYKNIRGYKGVFLLRLRSKVIGTRNQEQIIVGEYSQCEI